MGNKKDEQRYLMKFEAGEQDEHKNYQHQKEIAKILGKMEAFGSFSTIVDVPTGGGKTKIAIDFCVKALGAELGKDSVKPNGNKVLWLSDSIDLLMQSIEKFKKKSLGRDIFYQLVCSTSISNDDDSGDLKRSGSNPVNSMPDKIETGADILFVSIETIKEYKNPIDNQNDKFFEFARWLKASQYNEGKLYIIYDEAHHIGAEKTEDFLEKLFETGDREKAILKRYVFVGLTATVYRYDSPIASFNRWFKHGWDKSNSSVVVAKDSQLGDGIEGFINNRISVVDVKTLIDEKILMKPTIIRVDDFKEGMPDEKDEMKYLARKVANTYKGERWNKTIIFVETIEQAMTLYRELKRVHVRSFAYISKLESNAESDKQKDAESEDVKQLEKEFEYALVDFKKKGYQNGKIMIAVDRVSEGFDVPDLETVYLYSGIKSQIVLRQRIGRVLRQADGKEKATVYWQKYFKNVKKKGSMESPYDDIKESDEDIQRDIGLWKKGMQIPAGMYLEALPIDEEEEKELYVRMEVLNMLDLFGARYVADGMDFYECGDRKLYARKQEQDGYKQFYHMICADYWSCLVYREKYTKFTDYADALGGITNEKLLEDIKVNCFYLANVRKDDTSGKIIKKKRFIVEDEDISCFYEWVVNNDLKMPRLEISESKKMSDKNDTGADDTAADYADDQPSDALEEKRRELCEERYIKEYMEEHSKEKQKGLLNAMRLQQEAKRSLDKDQFNNPKIYAEILRYGAKDKYIYQQLCSVKAIIENGAVFDKREVGELYKIKGELALIGKDEHGKYCTIRALPRLVTSIPAENTLLLAQALISVPNHICVTKDDVDEYGDRLFSILKSKCNIGDDKKAKVVNEFIMALGYRKNKGNIIRMQCELFGDTLPRILIYVIYCEIYSALSEKVSYLNDKNEIVPECQNKQDLDEICAEKMNSYGVKGLPQDLKPVEDVIEDYRPYIKAVPYYQGIKPEYLCRMLNDMLALAGKKGYAFVDAFGGSGTVTLNMNSALGLKQSYNDLGIFNKCFFDVLCDRGCRELLKDEVKAVIKLVVDHTGDDNETQKFFEPYVELLKMKKNSDKCIETVKSPIETPWRGKVMEKTEKKLGEIEEQYLKILKLVWENPNNVGKEYLRNIESHLRAVILKISDIFMELKEDNYKTFTSMAQESNEVGMNDCAKGLTDEMKVNFALVFYLFNFINQRHPYRSVNIRMLARLVGDYERDIDNASAIFRNVDCCGRDALDLIGFYANDKNTVWYHDIPYSETSADNYVASWFDEVRFIDCLSKCVGDYIVASRFNISEKDDKKTEKSSANDEDPKEGKEHEGSEGREEQDDIKNHKTPEELAKKGRTKKQYGVIKFFSRFVEEEYVKKYREAIDKEYVDIVGKLKDTDTDRAAMYDWKHVKGESKEAKYIVFAYSRSEPKRKGVQYDKDGGNFKREASLSEDSIKRMLKTTQFSNISVEVMITNMEIVEKDEKDGKGGKVHKLKEGIWYMPTFKTNSAYIVEPVTIIMPYREFYNKMVLYMLSDAYEKISAKEFAAAYRQLYDKKTEEWTFD